MTMLQNLNSTAEYLFEKGSEFERMCVERGIVADPTCNECSCVISEKQAKEHNDTCNDCEFILHKI